MLCIKRKLPKYLAKNIVEHFELFSHSSDFFKHLPTDAIISGCCLADNKQIFNVVNNITEISFAAIKYHAYKIFFYILQNHEVDISGCCFFSYFYNNAQFVKYLPRVDYESCLLGAVRGKHAHLIPQLVKQKPNNLAECAEMAKIWNLDKIYTLLKGKNVFQRLLRNRHN